MPKQTFRINGIMVLNYIWIAFFVIAFVTGLFKLLFTGDYSVFPEMMNATFDSSRTAFEISLGLTGVLSLWMGIMKIGEAGGMVNVLARGLSPLFCKLFRTSHAITLSSAIFS